MSYSKTARQEAIIEIIQDDAVGRQEEVVRHLVRRGFSVTQASVSRDLVELGIVKVNGAYASPRNAHLPGFGMVNLTIAGNNLIIAKCDSGLASAIAVKIDNSGVSEVIGTIAGDDTVFIAVENSALQRSAIKKLLSVLGGHSS
ncbi:MAG: arginine repressor [Acidobacteriota bacterium]